MTLQELSEGAFRGLPARGLQMGCRAASYWHYAAKGRMTQSAACLFAPDPPALQTKRPEAAESDRAVSHAEGPESRFEHAFAAFAAACGDSCFPQLRRRAL